MGSLIIQKPMKREGKKQATKMIFPFPAPPPFFSFIKTLVLTTWPKENPQIVL